MSLILRRSLIFIALLLGGLMLYTFWFSIKADRYDDTAIPYLQTSVPIIAGWQYSRLAPLLSPRARADFENPELRRAYEKFEQLGQFESMLKPKYTQSFGDTSDALGDIEVVEYQAELQFTSGPAVIKVKLVADGQSYYIDHFGFQSAVFTQSQH